MMVPRSFVHTTVSPRRAREFNEKDAGDPRLRGQNALARSRESLSPPSQPLRAVPEPVRPVPAAAPKPIPPPAALHPTSQPQHTTPSLDQGEESGLRRESRGRALLAATAIPPRKRNKPRTSQRLPDIDHVAEFSRLMLDDVRYSDDGSLSGSLGNPHFESLFGSFKDSADEQESDENKEGEPTLPAARSMSSESIQSLGDESTATSVDLLSPSNAAGKPGLDRRVRQFSPPQTCEDDHPLLHLDDFTLPDLALPNLPSPVYMKAASRALPKGRTFNLRSNLTASLRALKSAAQTVSSIAATTPVYPPRDLLTHSIFSFKPELTDDKRPPPSLGPPTAELRRYLNPPPTLSGSPSELHFWQDHRSASAPLAPRKADRHFNDVPTVGAPIAFPLQTCIPSRVRSANASSPPTWLSPDGQPRSRNSAESLPIGPGLARQREPRENAEFLRILVAEMNMKRALKFADDAPSHASMWLPPRKPSEKRSVRGEERWIVWTEECAS